MISGAVVKVGGLKIAPCRSDHACGRFSATHPIGYPNPPTDAVQLNGLRSSFLSKGRRWAIRFIAKAVKGLFESVGMDLKLKVFNNRSNELTNNEIGDFW